MGLPVYPLPFQKAGDRADRHITIGQTVTGLQPVQATLWPFAPTLPAVAVLVAGLVPPSAPAGYPCRQMVLTITVLVDAMDTDTVSGLARLHVDPVVTPASDSR